MLSNLESFPVERTHLTLARRALDLRDLLARPRISVATNDLARCAGVHLLDDGFGQLGPWPIAVDEGVLTASFPVPHGRYEPVTPTEFQFVDYPEITLRFERLGEADYERATVQGPMRWPWRTASGNRAATPS